MFEMQPMKRQGRILIVDDNVSCVGILRRILHTEYTLELANDGHECLAKLPEFKPHLILLDIMMPGIDGYETCRRIKLSSQGSSVHVILVSCKELVVDRVCGYDALADDYVMKPFHHDELLSKVRAHFRMREMPTDPGSLGKGEVFTRQCSLVTQMSKTMQERLISTGQKLQNRCPPKNDSTLAAGRGLQWLSIWNR